MTIEEFLLARIDRARWLAYHSSLKDRDLQQLEIIFENQRSIIEWHKNWPVLVQKPMEYAMLEDFDPEKGYSSLINAYTIQAQTEFAWMTQEAYVKKFGSQPPTAPLLLQMAQKYRNHPDYNPEWE